MGNLATSINDHKYQISLLSLAATLGGFLYLQKHHNQQLRKLANSVDPQIPIVSHKHSHLYDEINEKVIIDQLIQYKQSPIYRIAITGGPCAGKSTAMDKICKHFQSKGFQVMVVPQIPTMVSQGGGMSDFPKYGSKDRMNFQLGIMKLKIYFEDYITKLAQMGKKPTLILCDRGLVDCAAYMPREQYQALLDEEAWTWAHVRDKRYDSVIFMNTAAKGAEEYYTLANNAARTETAEQARDLDTKTLKAWIGHPYLTICPNIKGKSFDYKVGLAIKAVQKTIGVEPTDIIYHKFLVEIDHYPQDLELVHSQIEQIYLKNNSRRYVQDKIKKRGQDNSYTYQRKFVGPYISQNTFRQVIRIPLNSLQYATLIEQEKNPFYRPVHIKRANFEWNGYIFAVDQIDYIKNHHGALLLRFEADRERDVANVIPDWIKVIGDVRKEPEFNLSRIAYQEY